MQVLPDAVVINISPSQTRIFKDAKYADCFRGVSLDAQGSRRPRIPVNEIPGLIERLGQLREIIVDDPEYQNQQPADVIDQIVLKIRDAAAAQRRAYPIIPTA